MRKAPTLRPPSLEAVDYLTKPVRRERLHAALQRLLKLLELLNGVIEPAFELGDTFFVALSACARAGKHCGDGNPDSQRTRRRAECRGFTHGVSSAMDVD